MVSVSTSLHAVLLKSLFWDYEPQNLREYFLKLTSSSVTAVKEEKIMKATMQTSTFRNEVAAKRKHYFTRVERLAFLITILTNVILMHSTGMHMAEQK